STQVRECKFIHLNLKEKLSVYFDGAYDSVDEYDVARLWITEVNKHTPSEACCYKISSQICDNILTEKECGEWKETMFNMTLTMLRISQRTNIL
ncbi:MAG: hypothetical protein ABW185_30245, partial [Sedimenticola sp.]